MENKDALVRSEYPLYWNKLLYAVCRQWHLVVKSGILLALVFASVCAVLNVTALMSEDVQAEAQYDYEIAMATYKATGETLQTDIHSLQAKLSNQKSYNHDSILMQINPFNKYVATITYYIDTQYQIMPEYFYQNVDYGPRLVQMYMSYMTGGEMYSEIAEQFSADLDIRFVEELFSITDYGSTGMIEIELCATSKESCQEVMNIISEGMAREYDDAVAQIGEHTLTKLNEYIYTTVDTQLDALQKENIQIVTDTTAELEEKTQEYKEWKLLEAPVMEYATEEVVKSIIKTFIVGGIVGVLLLVIYLACQYIFSDRVFGTLEFRSRVGLTILGEIPAAPHRKLFPDRWADTIGGIKLRSSDMEALTAAAAENILWMASRQCENTQTVALSGSVPQEELEKLCEKFQSATGQRIHFITAGNPLVTASAAEAARQSDAVVLVEKLRHTRYTDILNEHSRLASWGASPLGVVFLNADAIN